ncbi:MAG TPA: prepilin-type N-terminal cleavage/methylation domain-containing protein [Tepidisphaeraceae bacterium]|jgi:general secretion pathway protein G|nr:prepilin-type N-terminal cleavage/methylation domain-containing protein [Tepidisphaeraceae bacterium]
MTPAHRSFARIRRSRAFTLVEILIVVIILGILAAIVVPQFTNAATDARKVTMANQLKDLRTIIELYRLQHDDQLPDLLEPDGWQLLTTKTTKAGETDPAGEYGPYMQTEIVNPLTQSSVVVEIGSSPAQKPGWYFNPLTGAVHGANADGTQSDDGV